MNMKVKNIIIAFTFGLIITLFDSCVDLDVAPTNKFTEANYWVSQSNADAVLSMCYNQMFSSDYYFANEVLSDNIYNGRGSGSEKAIVTGMSDPTNSRFSGEWNDCYSGIKTCNVFMDNIDKVGMDDATKNQMKAECRFIRAFLYFRLTNWFGNVPFFTKDITSEEAQKILQSSQTDIKTWIHTELEDIVQYLPTNATQVLTDRGRITQGAAIAFNARVYLYDNDWQNCANECAKLINSGTYGTYSLQSDYSKIFSSSNEYNSEVILDMQYVPDLRTWGDMFDMAPLSGGARLNNYAPTQQLIDCYRMLNGNAWTVNDAPYLGRDKRMDATIVHDGSTFKCFDYGGGATVTIHTSFGSGTKDAYTGSSTDNASCTGYYYQKNYDTTASSGLSSGLNLILIRYADVLLMYAESMNELNQMNQALWDETLKPIRTRAGFAAKYCSYIALNQVDMRTEIRLERRCEFALEGTRVFDLRRWAKADGKGDNILVNTPKGAKFADNNTNYITLTPAWKYNHYYFAIPQTELDINPNLVQNSGY